MVELSVTDFIFAAKQIEKLTKDFCEKQTASTTAGMPEAKADAARRLLFSHLGNLGFSLNRIEGYMAMSLKNYQAKNKSNQDKKK